MFLGSKLVIKNVHMNCQLLAVAKAVICISVCKNEIRNIIIYYKSLKKRYYASTAKHVQDFVPNKNRLIMLNYRI